MLDRHPWLRRLPCLIAVSCVCAQVNAQAIQNPPVVVEDHGGVSALPYYRALNLLPDAVATPSTTAQPSAPPTRAFTDADMLPVHSAQLTPGSVAHRPIQAPGLSPVFVIGDDARSRAWIHHRLDTLRKLGAVGLVVNVESPAALDDLRRLAPGLTLAPTPGDDLAQRLGLQHYPVLITATGIEQ
ncbi:integrating conjugative element protein [Paraburkholderia ginsengisoli]|uniref:Integrating conjugative element protein n=1 Tax=Paraburkholderia ginsengisoli TaxID=311231 RepID=A0A7T4N337_9BURK|nr:integrating conjugative element protein [Paraburkholderia ginsengisoli]QQC64356.1 integrating conjugative element protein [Paraburkholderia ginsengisoli]